MSIQQEAPESETLVQGPAGADQDGAAAEVRYVGLATRVVAFAVDAALINLVALIVSVAAALILSLFHLPKDLKTVLAAIGGAAYILWTVGYFTAFWSTTGQSPGARVMQIRVVRRKAGPLKPRRALLRCVGVVLGALPLFAGYVLILFDARRRGFQDRLAGTIVLEAPELSLAQARRMKKRAAYEARRQRPPDESPAGGPPSSVSDDEDRGSA